MHAAIKREKNLLCVLPYVQRSIGNSLAIVIARRVQRCVAVASGEFSPRTPRRGRLLGRQIVQLQRAVRARLRSRASKYDEVRRLHPVLRDAEVADGPVQGQGHAADGRRTRSVRGGTVHRYAHVPSSGLCEVYYFVCLDGKACTTLRFYILR